jgi:hypothetical protein
MMVAAFILGLCFVLGCCILTQGLQTMGEQMKTGKDSNVYIKWAEGEKK